MLEDTDQKYNVCSSVARYINKILKEEHSTGCGIFSHIVQYADKTWALEIYIGVAQDEGIPIFIYKHLTELGLHPAIGDKLFILNSKDAEEFMLLLRANHCLIRR